VKSAAYPDSSNAVEIHCEYVVMSCRRSVISLPFGGLQGRASRNRTSSALVRAQHVQSPVDGRISRRSPQLRTAAQPPRPVAGRQREITTSAPVRSAGRSAAASRPKDAARLAVAGRRPSELHSTRTPRRPGRLQVPGSRRLLLFRGSWCGKGTGTRPVIIRVSTPADHIEVRCLPLHPPGSPMPCGSAVVRAAVSPLRSAIFRSSTIPACPTRFF
jgi:hypothetical protein